jgi:hypothetical protein
VPSLTSQFQWYNEVVLKLFESMEPLGTHSTLMDPHPFMSKFSAYQLQTETIICLKYFNAYTIFIKYLKPVTLYSLTSVL